MNRYIQILAKANAILFAFIIPFTIVYIRQERMYSRAAEVHMLYAAEMGEKGQAEFEKRKAASAKVVTARTLQTHTAQKTSLPQVSLSSSALPIPNKVNLTQAQTILPLIAECESGGDPKARSKISSAKGYLQIINGTWDHFQCEGNVLNKEDNFACGIKIATESGLHHWNESKACWAKKVHSNAILSEL
jgi:hypothetical protein